MPVGGVFIDTWGWAAISNARDAHHRDALDFYRNLLADRRQIVTSDYVVSETITWVFRRIQVEQAVVFIQGLFEAFEKNRVHLKTVGPDQMQAAWTLRKTYLDKPTISFADFTSMVVMQESNIDQVMTDDDHFEHVGLGFQKVPDLK